jgi:hypothetical protein
MCRIFLASFSTRYRLIVLPNFAISGASILADKLFVVATNYQRFGVANYNTNQTGL